jgi:AAA domain (dynein-related subfamily)/McrBC 5-methylcytosine restriction system component
VAVRQLDRGGRLRGHRQGQEIYLGVIASGPRSVGDRARRETVRSVEWLNADHPVPRGDLSPTVYSKLKTLLTLSNITSVVDELELWAAGRFPARGETTIVGTTAAPTVALRRADSQLAKNTLFQTKWLNDVIDLMAEKRQLVLYGPPGTGKTFFAQELADHLTAQGGETELVQFHPSYAYEDFFEGYRLVGSGTAVGFEVKPGPLKKLADVARADPANPYLLIVDEINRANLAKVFGELYFLLEYRDRTITLQYSDEEFTLPTNLYVIGTMNTPLNRPRRRGDAPALLFRRDVPHHEPRRPAIALVAQAPRLRGPPGTTARRPQHGARRPRRRDRAVVPDDDRRRGTRPSRTDLGARHLAGAARALLRHRRRRRQSVQLRKDQRRRRQRRVKDVSLTLREWGTRAGVTLTAAQVAALASLDAVEVTPDNPVAGTWKLRARHHVGVFIVDEFEVRIHPKVGVHRLLELMCESIDRVSRDEPDTLWAETDDLLATIAGSFCSQSKRALAQGLLQGYQAVGETLFGVKGRIDMSAQLSRRTGLALPVEVVFPSTASTLPRTACCAELPGNCGTSLRCPPRCKPGCADWQRN